MIKRVIKIYDVIKKRLPSTYPIAKLVFYQDEECLLIHNSEVKRKKDENIYAIVDPDTLTIHLPLEMIFEYDIRGQTITRTTKINQVSNEEIAHTLLHECAHLYFGERYGYNSKQYSDEKKCDQFADRWVKILYKENLL